MHRPYYVVQLSAIIPGYNNLHYKANFCGYSSEFVITMIVITEFDTTGALVIRAFDYSWTQKPRITREHC